MDHDYLDNLKRNHPTLKLLASDNAPLIISFLFRVYIQPNQRSASQSDLTTRLDDFLFHLHEIYGASKYPKTARQYLEDWSNDNTPFLRKYYTDIRNIKGVNIKGVKSAVDLYLKRVHRWVATQQKNDCFFLVCLDAIQ